MLAAARHRAVQEERGLRVILRVRPPEPARLPWEFLFDEVQNDYVRPTAAPHPSGSALAGLESEGLIELGRTAGDTWRDLRTALRGGGGTPWHVFRFIGHGGFDATAQEGTLRLSGEGGGTYDLGAENLVMVLEGRPSLRLVVLNACESGRSSAADPFSPASARTREPSSRLYAIRPIDPYREGAFASQEPSARGRGNSAQGERALGEAQGKQGKRGNT